MRLSLKGTNMLLQLRDMENRVYPRCRWKIQFIGHLPNLLQYTVRTKKFSREFQASPVSNSGLTIWLEFDVSQITNCKLAVNPVLVGLLFHTILSTLKIEL